MDVNYFVSYQEPVAKPRMTRSDRWKKRKCVIKYREFSDKLREDSSGFISSGTLVMHFFFSFKKSHSKKFIENNLGAPHTQKPDIDNCIKAVLDTLYENDSHVYSVLAKKFWTNRRDNAAYITISI